MNPYGPGDTLPAGLKAVVCFLPNGHMAVKLPREEQDDQKYLVCIASPVGWVSTGECIDLLEVQRRKGRYQN